MPDVMPDVMPTVGDHVQSSPKSLAYETVAAVRRTVVVAARVTRAEQAAFGEAQAHRHPNAVERGHEVGSGTGGWPPRRGAKLPSPIPAWRRKP